MFETIPVRGFRIVLSADRTLMANYPTLLEGMAGAAQATATPLPVMDGLLARRVPTVGVRAAQAPLGLRRIEAALLEAGFDPDDIAVVPPEKLPRAVGPDTRIVAVSSGDPVGLGMYTSTMTAIDGGRAYTVVLFKRLVAEVRRLRRMFPKLKLVVGGPGAWQLVQHDDVRRRLGINHVVNGYAEGDAGKIFRRLTSGEALPEVVDCTWRGDGAIPPVRGATMMGIVEISRGCGLGCGFCTIARVPMVHLPLETILADAQTNVAAGVRDISLISEDVFRYGGEGGGPNPSALLGLLRRLRTMPGLRMMQLDHANVSSVAALSDAELAEMHELLTGGAARHVWVNLGVETASGGLLVTGGGAAKMRPFAADDWAEACREQVRRLVRAGFTPMISLIVGLPGETPGDIEGTRRWVQGLRGERVVVLPVLLAPLEPEAHRPLKVGEVHPEHWRLFEESCRFNVRRLPRLFWDDAKHAGVPAGRRALIALLAAMNVMWWKVLFAYRS